MIGQVLGHYRVLEKIGSGGMGEVYRASDDRLGREVALKILKSSLAKDPDRLRRFEQEARAAAVLNHPNIVAIYDIGMHEGAPYIVSELLEGQTLRDRLLRGPLTSRQAADYSAQVAQGLVAAHEKRIVHRDLKPENLFITKDGRMKILDFGIAKLTLPDLSPEPGSDSGIAAMTTQTRAGTILGTVAYMSPEQLRARPVDHRSDIFSFGAILYEMLTGRRAFSGETQVDTMTAILKDDPPEISETVQSVPAAFEQIVRHCLEKEPENRFQSARDLAFALGTLSNYTTGKQIAALRAGRWRFRKLAPWAAAGILLAAVGVLLGFSFKPVHSPVFRRITFERGTVYSARFTPNGRNVIYGAAWNGNPLQIYSTIPDSLLARPLDVTSANLLALSRTSELALAVHGTHGAGLEMDNGMLARAPLVGGTPREILQDVRWADWSPGGDLAVVHHANGKDNLEFPIGKVLYETSGSISNIRFSPEGSEIAFMDHPQRWDPRGTVCTVDLSGNKKTLSPEWESEGGLAWAPNGSEVWFTAVESGSTDRALWAVSLSRRQRKVLAVPVGVTLQDIAPDGRVLATSDTERLAMEWTGRDDTRSRDLSWYDWTVAKDISPDGQWVLFEESSEPTGPNDAIAVRKIDGSAPTQLGEGNVDGLSPDGKWAISVATTSPPHLTLLPVGPGQARQISLPGLEHAQGGAHFLPDGTRIAINGNEAGHLPRTYLVDLVGSKPQPITPEGVYATIPSPDGKYLAGGKSGQGLTLFPLAGGSPRSIPGVDPAFVLTRWSVDSKALYVYRPGEVPMKVERLGVATGKTQLARELVPADRGGVVSIAPVVSNGDASAFVYSYFQTLSVLYVIAGLN